jgi:hypothetical protein
MVIGRPELVEQGGPRLGHLAVVDVKREQSLRGIRRLAMSPICLASRFDDDP